MKIAGLDRIETANGDAHLCLDIVPIDLNLLFTWFDLLAAALRLNGINPEDDLSIEYTFVSGAAYKGFRMLLRAGTDTQTLASYCLMAALRALPI